MKKLKLNEVCNLVGMTRRAIQECEDFGIAIKPVETNKYGHLLYGEDEIERLWLIRFYREMEYTKTDIEKIFNNPDYSRSEELEKQIRALEKKRDELDHIITIARKMRNLGVGPTAFLFPGVNDVISFNDYAPLLASGFRNDYPPEFVEDSADVWLTTEEENICADIVKIVFELADEGYEPESDLIQNRIKLLHNYHQRLFSDSIFILSMCTMPLAPSSEVCMEIDQKYGPGKGNYFYKAVLAYCKTNQSESDKEFEAAFDKLEELQSKGYKFDSPEALNEVSKMHRFFSQIRCLNESSHIRILENLADSYGSREFKQILDNGREKGATWYISNAIKHYCEETRRGTYE